MDHETLGTVAYLLEFAQNDEGDAPLFDEVELEGEQIVVTQDDGSRYRLTFEAIGE